MTNPTWISTADALPDSPRSVLARGSCRPWAIAIYFAAEQRWHSPGIDPDEFAWSVTHWMELPL